MSRKLIDILPAPELLLVEGRLWVLASPTGLGGYDFPFSRFFQCSHPWQRPERIRAVARV